MDRVEKIDCRASGEADFLSIHMILPGSVL
jgi:hypothetical protein